MTLLTQLQANELFRAPPDRHIDVGNGEVAVRSIGHGPDVLLVHGWPASGATFRGLLPHLTPRLRCHVIDLVGAGDSRFDRAVRIGIAEHAKALRRVVTALDVNEIAVVGHNTGGLIARHALAGDPRVRAWGLIDTEQPQGASWRFKSFLGIRSIPQFEYLLAHLVNSRRIRRNRFVLGDCFDNRDLIDGDFSEFFLRPLRQPDRRWAAGEFVRRFDLKTLDELVDLHRRIQVPVQLVWGARDPFFPLDRTQEMMAGFGGPVQLHVVEPGKLFVHEEFPKVTAEAMLPTLTG